MGGVKVYGVVALAAGALLAGCDNGPSAVARKERQEAAPAETPRALAETAEPRGERQEDHRAEAPLKVDGEAKWAATKRYSAEEGAQRTFERNGEDFGAGSVDAFVRKAHDFVTDPPAGVEKIEKANGDVLFYDARSNTFAVANRDGLPKTMFKPKDGADYWAEQKTRESRQTARRKSGGDSDEG
jgi:pyocin large subunit-like protein